MAGQARASATFAELSRRVEAFAVYVAVRAELAVFVAGGVAGWGGTVSGVLAAAGAASFDVARYFGYSHHDFRCDVCVAGSANFVDWGVCESF